ncbi:MAG: methyltransferase domain-containing protein [Pseudomonadota bacterium]
MSTRGLAGAVIGGLVLFGSGLALGRFGGVRVPEPASVATAAGSPARAALAQADPRDSLVFAPFNSLTNESPAGIAAARLLLRHLDGGEREPLEQALASYRELASEENFGGEYPTLQWFCEFSLAEEGQQAVLLENDDGRRFVAFFARDRWAGFREYLKGKYGMGRFQPEQLRFVDELVRFNSPYRQQWEHTDRILELLSVEPGMTVADIGAGAGFFSFRLAQAVGAGGRVLAVETNRHHLDYLRRVQREEGLASLEPVQTEGAFPALPPASLDRVLLCSTYQAIYLYDREDERTAWLEALKAALKPDGLVVISENEPVVPPGVVPYRGTSVSRPLIEGQLLAHGFELVEADQEVPQRYLLVLKKAGAGP